MEADDRKRREPTSRSESCSSRARLSQTQLFVNAGERRKRVTNIHILYCLQASAGHTDGGMSILTRESACNLDKREVGYGGWFIVY